MRTLRGLVTAILIVLISAVGVRPAAGAPEGQMTSQPGRMTDDQ